MTVLSSELRSALEKAIVAARDEAEEASRQALDALGVAAEKAPGHLGEDDRRLRVALRAEVRQLGGVERLVEECGYELWHRMLFARFLAENELLIHPGHGVAVSLADCEEIAHERGHADPWVVAAEFASVMLPGIFRQGDPVLRVRLAPEGQRALEDILAGLPSEVFRSDDGLGWVYQYWQAKKKKEVNASERKIGGADIAPVTQLFTEHYMVAFLLENTLGAWWAARHPDSPLVKEWEYLRFDDDGKPAAGCFPGWPETVAEVTVMDPCCGSGHFLVTAFEMLRKMRMEAEELAAAEAGDAVLHDNLFGLELDPRCTQIAAFALALQAWKSGGHRELPIPNVACSGISAKGRLEDWKKLADRNERLERSLERLHALFSDAGDLGSLIDPLRETDGELLAAQFDEVAPVLEAALGQEAAVDSGAAVLGHAALSTARAAALLVRSYTLAVTNVPYLARGRQNDQLRRLLDRYHPRSRADLATAFLERCERFASTGAVAAVLPQAWLSLGGYQALREDQLARHRWSLLARLGPGAFSSVGGVVVNVGLFILEVDQAGSGASWATDVSQEPTAAAKASNLQSSDLITFDQQVQMRNPDARIVLEAMGGDALLQEYGDSLWGLRTADNALFVRKFWEFPVVSHEWRFLQGSVRQPIEWGGREDVLRWGEGSGLLHQYAGLGLASLQGEGAWGRRGIAVTLSGKLPATLYTGEVFANSVSALWLEDEENLAAVWCFISSQEFPRSVRLLDSKLIVTNKTLLKVGFDLEHWKQIASSRYPAGLPAPNTVDPTQWLYDGSFSESDVPTQVGVARLCCYLWPRQTGSTFHDCPSVASDALDSFADGDGVVCVSPIRGEHPAAERLRLLWAAAFGEEWSSAKEADLLAAVGYGGKSLERWLRDRFFEQHCQLFHQRPFVWQIWDGRRDGFSALVNYHRLDRANLEKLIYTYLGDWITQQRAGVEAGTAGSEARLAAAQELQSKLELILEGEPPYDIFVRWKPLEEQPLGWEPDLNDGVRLNIRPFMTAGVLRKNPKINWNKDRGKDPESAPWYPVFKGDRINDHHLTLAEKRAAREAAARRADA